MTFYLGMHHPHQVGKLEHAMVSANALRGRVSGFPAPSEGWILDSGAFTQLVTHGGFEESPEDYAASIRRWAQIEGLHAAVSQDYVCAPDVLERLSATIQEHQRETVARHDAIQSHLHAAGCETHLMPVLQGWEPADYVRHIKVYGARLPRGAWVGVGSLVTRQSHPPVVRYILREILRARPDLRLHGFGLKRTCLAHRDIRGMLHSADSMAWSYAARKEGRDSNCPEEALRWERSLTHPQPAPLFDSDSAIS